MKKSFLFIAILIVMVLGSCSSVLVLDSWQRENISQLKDNNFLIIARTPDKQARIAFETESVKQLKAKGYNAAASFEKFPDFDPNKSIATGTETQILSMLESKGYNSVVLTILKDYKEENRTKLSTDYNVGGNINMRFPLFGNGFNNYYYHPSSSMNIGANINTRATQYKAKIYVVETTVYDLTEEKDQQLAAVVTSKIDNPQDASKTAKDFVAQVMNHLK